VAGVVEGFLSPAPIPAGLKFGLAGVLFALLVLYLGSPTVGRSSFIVRRK
jgi:hypothetical protein